MVLEIAAELDYKTYMMDVQTAFLNTDVEENVFVKMPPGTSAATRLKLPS